MDMRLNRLLVAAGMAVLCTVAAALGIPQNMLLSSHAIHAANADVEGAPEAINQDAYSAWMFKLKPDNAADLDGLLDAAAYQALVDSEAH